MVRRVAVQLVVDLDPIDPLRGQTGVNVVPHGDDGACATAVRTTLAVVAVAPGRRVDIG